MELNLRVPSQISEPSMSRAVTLQMSLWSLLHLPSNYHELEVKDSKLAGAYSNQYGATAISSASPQDDVIKFDWCVISVARSMW